MAYLVFLHACFWAGLAARANVYPTNLRVNHSTNNTAFSPGNSVEISYILNEPASAGVTVQIFADTNVVQSFDFSAGAPGSLRGTNSVFWDGTDTNGFDVSEGLYSVSVKARSVGYDTWTQTTDDNNDGNFVLEPRGIAVNQNTNSPYYGRVFVGNAQASGAGGDKPGAKVGILKLNADGSGADEGTLSTSYPWAGDFYSPWKIEVAADDKVYINDWNATTEGIVIAFDEEISSDYSIVLSDSNWPNNGVADLSGPFITGSGTNTQIWMADVNVNTNFGSVGIVGFNVGPDGIVANGDTGFEAVPTTNSDLDMAPYDVAIDKAGYIYTIQRVTDLDNPENRVMRFPPFDGTNVVTNADWKIGANDNTLINAYGIAVNPSATYVAVASRGYGANGQFQFGNVSVFNAANGDFVTSFSDGTNSFTDVTWDAVGNLYMADSATSLWRAYSPPGTNEATTVSVPMIQVYSQINPPQFTTPALNDTQDGFQFSLLGQSNVTYLIESTIDLTNWSAIDTNYSSTLNERPIAVPLTNDMLFFRASVRP